MEEPAIKTAIDLLWQSAARLPKQLAVVDDASDRRLTYAELVAEIETVAAGLAALGVRADDRFATVLPGSLDLVVTVFALSRLGATPALINPRLKPEEIGKLVAAGGMSGALAAPSQPVIDAVHDALPQRALLLAPGEGHGKARGLAACRGDRAKLGALHRPAGDDPAYIFYTSGTTGLPKAVLIPQRATEARIANTASTAALQFGPHNRFLGFMALNHAIGFFGVLIPCLAFNGTYFAEAAFAPDRALAAIERHRVTFLFATPTHYHLMLEAPSFADRNLSSLQMICYGAAPLSNELLQRMARGFNSRICHIYGTTETMCSLYQPAPLEHPDTLLPTYYSTIRVVRNGGGTGDVVAPGEEGELLVDASAGMTFTAYLGRPDATAEKLVDGWYRTGDIVRLNEDASVTLKGRVDDIIRSGAENVHPVEVEAVLAAHPGVADAAVIGIPDARWGELVVACVVTRTPGATAQDLHAHCRSSDLAGYKRPRAYLRVDALPRNAANKVLRGELKAAAVAARDQGDARFLTGLDGAKGAS